MKHLHFLLGTGLWLIAASAGAHNVDEMLKDLQEDEPYMQRMDPVRTDFALEDADGRNVGLADFRGKVVILNRWSGPRSATLKESDRGALR